MAKLHDWRSLGTPQRSTSTRVRLLRWPFGPAHHGQDSHQRHAFDVPVSCLEEEDGRGRFWLLKIHFNAGEFITNSCRVGVFLSLSSPGL